MHPTRTCSVSPAILETEGWIEIFEGNLEADSQVITAGKDLLWDCDTIMVIRKD